MNAVFLFKGQRIIIDVPQVLYHLNELTNVIADSDIDSEFMYGHDDAAYECLCNELLEIFVKNQNLDSGDLYVEFLMPETNEDRVFGSIINVIEIKI